MDGDLRGRSAWNVTSIPYSTTHLFVKLSKLFLRLRGHVDDRVGHTALHYNIVDFDFDVISYRLFWWRDSRVKGIVQNNGVSFHQEAVDSFGDLGEMNGVCSKDLRINEYGTRSTENHS